MLRAILKFIGRPPRAFFDALEELEPQRRELVTQMAQYGTGAKTLQQALTDTYEIPVPLSADALQFGEALLRWNPQDRASAREALQHRFLQNVRDVTDEPGRLRVEDSRAQKQYDLERWKGFASIFIENIDILLFIDH